MTVKEFKEVLASENVPDDAEVCYDDYIASLKELRRMELRYPRYKAAYIRTIHKLRAGNYLNDYPDATDEEVFQWWLSKRNAKAFFGDLKNQMKLF